jgi:hypothetical protein
MSDPCPEARPTLGPFSDANLKEQPRLCSGARVQRRPLPIRTFRLLLSFVSAPVQRVQKVSGCRSRLFALEAQ